jgi:hypothetical protein
VFGGFVKMEKKTLADKYLTFSEESKKLLPPKAVELLINTFNKVYPKICDFFSNGEILNVILTAKPEHGILPSQFVLVISKTDYGVEVEKWEEQHIEFSSHDQIFQSPPYYDIDFITHELVHVAQNSKYEYPIWINEGLADYGRAKFGLYNEKAGWCIPKVTGNKNKKQYQQGYVWAAGFFIWIEENIDVTLPQDINNTIKKGKYTDNYFVEKTGKTLDELWEMYLYASNDKFFSWVEENFDIKMPEDLNYGIILGEVSDADDNHVFEKTGKTLDELWEAYVSARR